VDWYKALWSHIGGRPWTYILRDAWAEWEGLWIIGLVAGGAVIGEHVGLLDTLLYLGVFAVGYLAGHLFWGTEYMPHQTGGPPL